uniref:Uncharacterized protein n=1 Tax=Cacopsylla melanoneura TaxID=428564 RepID=A0A8D8TBE4_9HEMI
MAPLCFICDSSLEGGTSIATVQARGIASLIEASKKRKDGKKAFLRNKTTVEVHENCRKLYINERMILAHLKRVQEGGGRPSCSQTVAGAGEGPISVHPFKFKICGEAITKEFIAAESKRAVSEQNTVYVVRQLEVETTLMNAARARDDGYGRDLIDRIEHVQDLVAADGQYHIKCFKGLYARPKVEEPKRRGPFVMEIDNAMEYI